MISIAPMFDASAMLIGTSTVPPTLPSALPILTVGSPSATVIVFDVLITLSPVVVLTPDTFTVYMPPGTVVPLVYVPPHVFALGSVTSLLYNSFTRLPLASSILMIALTRSENLTSMLVVCGGVIVVFVMV